MNQAIGMIETRGLLALIEATDAMLKSADVQCLGKKQVSGGLNAVLVTGDVAAVQTAVQAGSASVERLGAELLTAAHVIPRPTIDALEFVDQRRTREERATEIVVEALIPATNNDVSEVIEVVRIEGINEEVQEINKELVEGHESIPVVVELEVNDETEASLQVTQTSQRETLLQELQQMKVTELRKLAKEQTNFSIPHKNIYSTKKEKLINALLDSLIINE